MTQHVFSNFPSNMNSLSEGNDAFQPKIKETKILTTAQSLSTSERKGCTLINMRKNKTKQKKASGYIFLNPAPVLERP